MEILQDIEIVDLVLWLKKEKAIVISDIHIGYEGMLKHQGMPVPRFQLNDILIRIKKILNKTNPERIIINGDLKHAFGEILKQEWNDTLLLIDFLSKHCQEIILIKGNHDVFLKPIADKRKIKIIEDYTINDLFITHGDKIKETNKETIIIAHEHPAIVLKDKIKSEKYKCFLKGRWKDKNLLVTPSFNPISDGSDVTKGGEFSPYVTDTSNFEVYAVGEKVYNLGKIKDLI